MEYLDKAFYYVGFVVLGSIICSLTLYLIHKTHKLLQSKSDTYKRIHGMFISFPIAYITVLCFSKNKAIRTYAGWCKLEQDEKQIFEYRAITKLLEKKASIKSNLEYSQAKFYLKQNQDKSRFDGDYAYRLGLKKTIEDFQIKNNINP